MDAMSPGDFSMAKIPRVRFWRRAALLVAAAFALGAVSAPDLDATETPAAEALELFARDVLPVLVETCQKCHGPDKQENDLRLDSPEAAVRGGASGAVIVPGKPNESLLV